MSNNESIGYCQHCGLMDHHLFDDLCPRCLTQYKTLSDHDINHGEHACNDQVYRRACREMLCIEVSQ